MKKLISLLIISVMILSSAVPAFAASGREPAGTVTITDGELVAVNYDGLTDEERALLCSPLVAGESRTVTTPGEASVELDADDRSVVAKPYSDSGLVWYPVSARVIYEDGEEEITLGENGKGIFEYEGNVYTVEVDYDAEISAAADVQRRLLNGPYYLWRGVSDLDAVDEAGIMLNLVSSYFDYFVRFTDESLDDSVRITDKDALDAIADLDAQRDNNDGMFYFETELLNYEDVPSKTEYLFENGAEFGAHLSTLGGQLNALANISNLDSIIDSLPRSDKRKFNSALSAVDDILAVIYEVDDFAWPALDDEKAFLKSGLSSDDYAELDGYVSLINGAEYHGDEIKGTLSAGTVTVKIDVERYDVAVTVAANVIANSTRDSAETTPLEVRRITVRVFAGATADEVKAAVEKSGIEGIALTAWIDISEDNYVRTESDLPDTVNEDIEYAITYSPKDITATYGFETTLPATVPYGYNMTLPLHGGDELVYDYEIGGKRYLEGDVYKVTGDFTVNRSEGKPWDAMRLAQIVADVYADELTEGESEALSSAALKSDTVLLRKPTNDDGLLTVTALGGDDFEVTASDYPSGIEGIFWTPSTGKAVNGTQTVAEFTFVNGKAEFNTAEFERVEVEYGMTLTNVTDGEIVDIMNLPGILAGEADYQIENMGILDKNYDNLESLDKKTLKAIQIAVKGSDMSEESKEAAKTLIDSCVEEESTRLYAYAYLTEYHEGGLAYYYRDKNYAKLENQLQILKSNFTVIYSDPEFINLLITLEYEDYYDRIGELLEEIKDVDLTKPNSAVDILSDELEELIEALAKVSADPRSFDSADRKLTLVSSVSAANDTYVKGDITGDGELTMSDVLKMRLYVAGLGDLTEEEFIRGDLTGDGDVTMSDVLRLRKIVAGVD